MAVIRTQLQRPRWTACSMECPSNTVEGAHLDIPNTNRRCDELLLGRSMGVVRVQVLRNGASSPSLTLGHPDFPNIQPPP